jgi:aspartate kinase
MPISYSQKPWIVQKYGGTSLGKLLQKVCGTIIPSYLGKYHVAVVCSALSGTTKSTGTTSLLLECVRHSEVTGAESRERIIGIIDIIRDSHLQRLESLRTSPTGTTDPLLNETKTRVIKDCEEIRTFLLAAQVRPSPNKDFSHLSLLSSIQIVGDLSSRSKDRVLALGEKLACQVVAAALTIQVHRHPSMVWVRKAEIVILL